MFFYCLTMYCSDLWLNSTKTALTKLKIAYDNSLHILLGLPKYNSSASEMFVNLGILYSCLQSTYNSEILFFFKFGLGGTLS